MSFRCLRVLLILSPDGVSLSHFLDHAEEESERTIDRLSHVKDALASSMSPPQKEFLMSRFLLAAAAGVLTLALANPAHARGPSHSGGMSRPSILHGPSYNSSLNRSFVQTYGTKMSHGYSFSARNFYWTSRYWSSRYGCYCYWCPYVNCWYYWCAAQSCYYPISYITVVPPTVVVTPATVTVTTPGTAGPTGPSGAMPPAGPAVP
jgi:hypothetical protein